MLNLLPSDSKLVLSLIDSIWNNKLRFVFMKNVIFCCYKIINLVLIQLSIHSKYVFKSILQVCWNKYLFCKWGLSHYMLNMNSESQILHRAYIYRKPNKMVS